MSIAGKIVAALEPIAGEYADKLAHAIVGLAVFFVSAGAAVYLLPLMGIGLTTKEAANAALAVTFAAAIAREWVGDEFDLADLAATVAVPSALTGAAAFWM
jgi:hypothetical protein